MYTFKKRVLSVLLALILCAGLVPAVLADEAPAETEGIAEPAEAEESEEAQEPAETEEPEEAETEETAEAEDLTETDAPVETEEPAGTEEPSETAEPTEAEEPAVTEEPAGSEEQDEPTSEEPASEEPSEEPALDGANSGRCGAGVTWSLSGGVLTISGSGAMYDYEAPSMDWGSRGRWAPWYADHSGNITAVVVEKGVTSIGKNAFYDLSYVTQVSLPASVTAIEASAFERCGMWNMIIGSGETMTVELKEGLRTIGDRAFANSSLRALELPASVTGIGVGFVLGCKELETISVASRNTAFKTVDGGLLTKDGGEFIACPAKMTGRYAVPKSVTRIVPYAFYGCGALTDIALPDTVVHIDSFAFYGCTGLHELWMPSLLLELSDQALPSGGSLERLYLPQGLQHISCTVLGGGSAAGLHVYFGGSAAGWNDIQPTEAEVQLAYENTWGADDAYLARIRRPFADAAEIVFNAQWDEDEDGLPLWWELFGADTDKDGIVDVNLPTMGADPKIPDIFVEVDWMAGCEPDPAALDMVVKQFAQPHGSVRSNGSRRFPNGISLHIDAGPYSVNYPTGLCRGNAISYEEVLDLDNRFWADSEIPTNHDGDGRAWAKVTDLARDNFWSEPGRRGIFRYCLFVNSFYSSYTPEYEDLNGRKATMASGIGNDIPGQYFIIALNYIDTQASNGTTRVAGTFMHELGHTLGLRLGGDDSINEKPNYLSVMNYKFQMSGMLGLNEWEAVNYSEYVIRGFSSQDINEKQTFDFINGVPVQGLRTYITFDVNSPIRVNTSVQVCELTPQTWHDLNLDKKFEEHAAVPDIYLGEHDGTKELVSAIPASVNDWDIIDITSGGILSYGAVDREQEDYIPVGDPDVILETLPKEEPWESTPAPGTLRGDINGDGLANRADRVYLARALAGWTGYNMPGTSVGDVNRDDTVNRADRVYLARALAGWDGYRLT